MVFAHHWEPPFWVICECEPSQDAAPELYDMLMKMMLVHSWEKRATLSECLKHPYIANVGHNKANVAEGDEAARSKRESA